MTALKRYRIFPMMLLALCLAGCSNSRTAEAVAPFSALTWDSSPEDMNRLEKDATESYASVYNGTTYVYEREYQGRNGSLKYMFDDEDKLMCIAWACEAADAGELDRVYQSLHAEVEEACGASGYNPSGSTNYGDVWYREDGDIIISAVTAEDQYAIQYAYLNPLVSNQDADHATR